MLKFYMLASQKSKLIFIRICATFVGDEWYMCSACRVTGTRKCNLKETDFVNEIDLQKHQTYTGYQ